MDRHTGGQTDHRDYKSWTSIGCIPCVFATVRTVRALRPCRHQQILRQHHRHGIYVGSGTDKHVEFDGRTHGQIDRQTDMYRRDSACLIDKQANSDSVRQ